MPSSRMVAHTRVARPATRGRGCTFRISSFPCFVNRTWPMRQCRQSDSDLRMSGRGGPERSYSRRTASSICGNPSLRMSALHRSNRLIE